MNVDVCCLKWYGNVYACLTFRFCFSNHNLRSMSYICHSVQVPDVQNVIHRESLVQLGIG